MLIFTKLKKSKRTRQCSGSREPKDYELRAVMPAPDTMLQGGKSHRKGPYDKGKGGKTADAGSDALPSQQEENAILLEPWKEPEERIDLSETTKEGIKWSRMINVLTASVTKLLDNKRLELEVMNSQMSSLHQALVQLERVWNEAESSGHLHCEGFGHIIAQIKEGKLRINKKFLDMNGTQMAGSITASSSAGEFQERVQQQQTNKNLKTIQNHFVLISDSTGLQGNSNDHHKLGDFAKVYMGKFFDQVHFRAEGGARIYDTIKRGTGTNKQYKPTQDFDYVDPQKTIFPGILEMVRQEIDRVGGTYHDYPHHLIVQSSCNEASAKKHGKAHDPHSEQPHPEIEMARMHWKKLETIAATIPMFTLIAAGDEESWQLPGFKKYVDHVLQDIRESGCLCYTGIPLYSKMTKLVAKRGTVDDWHWACTENNQDKQCLMYFLLTQVRHIINELKISLGPRSQMLSQEQLPPGEVIDIHENNTFNVLEANHNIIRQQKIALGEANNKFFSRLSQIPGGKCTLDTQMIALACEWANYQRTVVPGDYLAVTGNWKDYLSGNLLKEWDQIYPFGTHKELLEPNQIFGPIEEVYVASVENTQIGGFIPCLGVRCAQQKWQGGPLQSHGYTLITRGAQPLAKLVTERQEIGRFIPPLLSENGKADLKSIEENFKKPFYKAFKMKKDIYKGFEQEEALAKEQFYLKTDEIKSHDLTMRIWQKDWEEKNSEPKENPSSMIDELVWKEMSDQESALAQELRMIQDNLCQARNGMDDLHEEVQAAFALADDEMDQYIAGRTAIIRWHTPIEVPMTMEEPKQEAIFEQQKQVQEEQESRKNRFNRKKVADAGRNAPPSQTSEGTTAKRCSTTACTLLPMAPRSSS